MIRNFQLRGSLLLFQLSSTHFCYKVIVFSFSFREFILYLLKTDVHNLNNHWSPYYLHCSPCIANFSVVLKLDSAHYELEENFLIQKTSLFKPEHRNMGIGKKNVNETYEYFNDFDCNTVKKL